MPLHVVVLSSACEETTLLLAEGTLQLPGGATRSAPTPPEAGQSRVLALLAALQRQRTVVALTAALDWGSGIALGGRWTVRSPAPPGLTMLLASGALIESAGNAAETAAGARLASELAADLQGDAADCLLLTLQAVCCSAKQLTGDHLHPVPVLAPISRAAARTESTDRSCIVEGGKIHISCCIGTVAEGGRQFLGRCNTLEQSGGRKHFARVAHAHRLCSPFLWNRG